MGKFNLSEAAKDILNASVESKRGSQDPSKKLDQSVAYGTKAVGDIGTEVTKTTDGAPDATKGVPTATPPGATPPVGSEPMKKLAKQPGEEGYVEQPEGKPGVQKMAKNPGATFQSYGEGLDMSADVAALMEGESLSEEFKQKATTIFEAAVISRVEAVAADVEARLTEEFDVAVEAIKEELAEKVDGFLNYMVEEWMKENELAIDSSLRAELAEDFILGLRNLYIEHNIDIPEDKVDIVEELSAKVEELTNIVNEQVSKNIELVKTVNEQKKVEAIYTACEGLTQTQVEKLKALAEGVEFTTEEEFVEKIETLKESYFKSDVKPASSSALEEVHIEEEVKPAKTSNLMESYTKAISSTQVK